MNTSQLYRQRGAVLLLMFITLLLAVTTVVLSALNDRYDYQLVQQQQTQRVLHQAKQALIGFAAGYDQTHSDTIGVFTGYLPCPDLTGDGSANPPCAMQGETVLGRYPWRTLGVPPLRDGSGECLWYAVSGSFKDNPDLLITSDTDGDIIIADKDGNTLHGSTPLNRAIAVVFAPNKPLSNQSRGRGNGTGNITECGYRNGKTEEINQASNYLETLGSVNNATGGGRLESYDTSANRMFRDTDETDNNYPTFVKAATSYNNDGDEIFNDALAVITPDDFAPVFKLMDYYVTYKSLECIENYFQTNKATFFTTHSTPIGDWENPHIDTYRADATITAEINLYIAERTSNCRFNNCNDDCNTICATERSQCTDQCITTFQGDADATATCSNQCISDESDCVNDCGDAKATCEANCGSTAKLDNYRKTAIDISVNYPWTAGLDNPDFKEQDGQRFGRIPSVLSGDTVTPLALTHSRNTDMSANWIGDCFNETTASWRWWEVWKDSVFYILDDDYDVETVLPETQIWVKTEHAASSTGTGASKTWTLNPRDGFITRRDNRKASTIARLPNDQKDQYDGWEFGTVPPSSATSLTMSSSSLEHSFLVISAGRRLAVNNGSSTADYGEFTQIRDADSFCSAYNNNSSLCGMCTATPYAASCYKSRIDNYLEGEAHNSLNLRKVVSGAMVGGNIPIDYVTQNVASVPTGDEEFIQENIDINFFTDFVCYSKNSCNAAYNR